jgi:hypothetical protein
LLGKQKGVGKPTFFLKLKNLFVSNINTTTLTIMEPTTWMLRQNFYGNISNGLNQKQVKEFIQEAMMVTCPYGHIEKETTNPQYIRFMSGEMKKGDIILIPLKGQRKYIKAILEDNEVKTDYDSGYYYLSNADSIQLTREGITPFKPHIRTIEEFELKHATFDMRKFPRTTFCKMPNGEPN